MKENEKKFYELTEEEQKQRLEQIKRKNKELIKKIALGAFCVITILLLIFGLLSGMFKGNVQDTSSQAIALFFR